MVSSRLNTWGLHVINSVVLVLPPNDSFNIWVSLESRKGTCVRFDFVKALMQFPRALSVTTRSMKESYLSDWLIFFASSRVSPVAPVFPTFSDPAKSARFNLPWASEANSLFLTLFCGSIGEFLQQVQHEQAVAPWADVVHLRGRHSPVFLPQLDQFEHVLLAGNILCTTKSNPAVLGDTCSVSDSTHTPLAGVSRTLRFWFFGFNKSFTTSLYISKKLHLIVNSIPWVSARICSKMCAHARGIIPHSSGSAMLGPNLYN